MVENQALPRWNGVDLWRGITIFLMIFCNYGFTGSPDWLRHHQPYDASGITMVDLIFPVFLFLVGVSVVPAFRKYADCEHGVRLFLRHVLLRFGSLLVMGLLCVNTPGDMLGIPGGWWESLALGAVLLAWHRIPHDAGRTMRIVSRGLRWAGILFLAAYVILFRAPDGGGWATLWWGILGLIAWVYLVTALMFLGLRKTPELAFFAPALLIGVYIAGRSGAFAAWGKFSQDYTLVSSLPSLALMGLALAFQAGNFRTQFARTARCFLGFIVMALGCGLAYTVLWGVNKNNSTPSWCFYGGAAGAAGWLICGWLLDVRQYRGKLLDWMTALGRTALTAYVLHLFFEVLIPALGWKAAFYYPGSIHPLLGGLTTFLAAWGCCELAIVLGRKRISLRV